MTAIASEESFAAQLKPGEIRIQIAEARCQQQVQEEGSRLRGTDGAVGQSMHDLPWRSRSERALGWPLKRCSCINGTVTNRSKTEYVVC